MSTPINKVLLVLLDNLGDCVMGSGLLWPLRRLYPDATIGMWVKQYACELFKPSMCLDRIHAADSFWDRSPGRQKGSLAEFLEVWNEIRRERYDLVFVLNTEWRRALACFLAGIPHRIGFGQRKSGPFLTRAVSAKKKGPHVIDDHKQLLMAWTDRVDVQARCFPHMELSEHQKVWASRWRSHRRRRGKRVIAVHPLSGDPRKNWPLEKWVGLVDLIERKARSCFIVLLGSRSESQLLREAFPAISDIEIVAGASLADVKGILSQADVLIGGDSGLGHLAAALGCPVLSLFGEKKWSRYGPMGPGKIKILYTDPLRDLAPSRVFKEASLILNTDV